MAIEKDKNEKQRFAERLKKLRIGFEMSQQELAEACNVSRQTITLYETKNNSIFPQYNSLKQLCFILGCSADYLLGLE